MYARIIDGKVAALTEEAPALVPGECALIVEVHDWEVREGWLWTPEGCINETALPGYAANKRRAEIDAELASLDNLISRATEDICADPSMKNKLSQISRDRMDRKAALRLERAAL